MVVDNLTHDGTSGAGGIRVDSSSMTVTNNECYNDAGMNLNGDGLASGNHIHDIGGGLWVTADNSFVVENNESDRNNVGISVVGWPPAPVLVQNNLIHENSGDGLDVNGASSEAIGNRIYLNDATGLYLYNGAAARRNVVYSNGGDGVHVDSCYALITTIQNNLIYDNGTGGSGYYNVNIPPLP